MGYNHNYSHVICIGDEFTDEVTYYKKMNLWNLFQENNYEFKSYPQLLGEKLNCEWEVFGDYNKSHTYYFSMLINKLEYILSLENPLVIFQFGNFYKYSLNKDIVKKDNLTDFFKKVDTAINYWYIEEFIKTCKLINTQKSIKILGLLRFIPSIQIPDSEFILNFSKSSNKYEKIGDIFPELNEVDLKSTMGNDKLSNLILTEIFPKPKSLF